VNFQSSAAPPLFVEGAFIGENGIMQFLFEKRDAVPEVFK
jgi:hypothetical protein